MVQGPLLKWLHNVFTLTTTTTIILHERVVLEYLVKQLILSFFLGGWSCFFSFIHFIYRKEK